MHCSPHIRDARELRKLRACSKPFLSLLGGLDDSQIHLKPKIQDRIGVADQRMRYACNVVMARTRRRVFVPPWLRRRPNCLRVWQPGQFVTSIGSVPDMLSSRNSIHSKAARFVSLGMHCFCLFREPLSPHHRPASSSTNFQLILGTWDLHRHNTALLDGQSYTNTTLDPTYQTLWAQAQRANIDSGRR